MKLRVNVAVSGFMAALLFALIGCARVPDNGRFDEVRSMVQERTGAGVMPYDDDAASLSTRHLLDAPLTVESSLQLAMINNPSIQATLSDLDIASADFAEALIFPNPHFEFQARFPSGDASGTNLEFQIVQSILEFLMYPSRKRLALDEYDQAKRRVITEIFKIAIETRKAWWELAAAESIVRLRQSHLHAAEAMAELAQRQVGAGTASDLFLNQMEIAREEERIAHRGAVLDAVTARDRLNRLMGLDSTADWTLPPAIPGLPVEEISMTIEALHDQALANRLELINARQESALLAQMIATKSRWRWIPFLEVGANAERELDGQWVAGPSIQIEIPLFNRGQAGLKRLKALEQKNQHRIREIELEIISEVNLAVSALAANREAALQSETSLIPLREQAYRLTREYYYFMLKDTYDLLDARMNQWEVRINYIHSLRDYWMARADLEHALGVRLPTGELSPPASGESAQQLSTPSQQHKHH